MLNEILTKTGTPIVWADTTDFPGGGVGGLVRTHQIDLTSLASGAARQGAKADLGATRARRFAVVTRLEYAVAPTAADLASIWLGESHSGTAGTLNPGNLTGADAAYTGYSGGTLADSIKQLRFAGAMILENVATTTVQYQSVGIVEDLQRYVSPVLYNEADQALFSDAVEMLIALIPLIDEVQ